MIRKLLLAATAFTALSGVALAADLPARVAAPMYPAPIFTWSGFYVGAVAGGGVATPVIDDFDCNLACTSLSMGKAFGTIGGTVGWNTQVGRNFVLGVEGDASWMGYKAASASADWGSTGSYHEVKSNFLATLRGRAGLAVDNALIYVTGGAAWLDQKARGSNNADLSCTDASHCFNSDKTQLGAALGVGVEYAFSPNWSLKAEYIRVIAPKTQINDIGTNGYARNDYNNYRVSNSIDMGRVGLNYKFGGL